MKILFLIAFICIFSPTFATLGVDVSQPTSTSDFQCLSASYHFAIVRCFRSSGSPDPAAPQTISNAWAGGMDHVDVYMFPCPTCGNGANQVKEAYNALSGSNFGMFWFDIEGSQYWSSSQSTNQQFFEDMVQEAQSLGLSIGVYTSSSQWGPIMGSSYTGGSSFPLWYAHYDGSPNFNDFGPFGGWSSPSIKQFRGDQSICGAGIDENWYPN